MYAISAFSSRSGTPQALPDPAASYDAALSALVLNFIPQPERAVRELRGVSSQVAASPPRLDYAGKMQLLRHFWNAACRA